ncbi:PepSY-like domain-containing protein, partial [Salinimicrobium oceani]
SAALPQAILTYISTNYPENTIREAEVEDNGQFEVELNNGTELVFDAQGNFLGIDDDSDDVFGDEDIAAADLPEKIRNFISTHFSGATIEEAELENNGNYEVELSTD